MMCIQTRLRIYNIHYHENDNQKSISKKEGRAMIKEVKEKVRTNFKLR